MPDFRVYVPESKAAVMYQFKEQFGKEGSPMVLNFMEESIMGKEITAENMGAEIARVYDIYFGDISDEREFTHLLGGRKSAETAVSNRFAELNKKYPDIYLDIIAKFKENYPNLAKNTGVSK